jgi:hypothetical protein
MTRARYIPIVTAAYCATFVALPLILGAWLPYPAYDVILMIAVGALFFAWLGTGRVQQIVGADETEFTAASGFHAAFIIIMLAGAAYIRLSGAP